MCPNLGIYQGVGSEDVVDNAGTISMRYSINDYRTRSDGVVGNSGNSSSSVVVVGGGSGGISGSGLGGLASSSSSIISDVPHSPTPPLQRRLAKSFSVAPSSTQNKGALFIFYLYKFTPNKFIFLSCRSFTLGHTVYMYM